MSDDELSDVASLNDEKEVVVESDESQESDEETSEASQVPPRLPARHRRRCRS